MKKILPFLIVICMCLAPWYITGCGLEKYKSQDIIDLYKTVVENQIDANTSTNEIFANDYRIDIKYTPTITNIVLSDSLSNNEYNLYTLDRFYNRIFEAIFRYYEDWNDNFYETADLRLSNEDFNNLHTKLRSLNNTLIELSDKKLALEEQLTLNPVSDVASYYITNYIYYLNRAVGDSLDFMLCFRDLHYSKIFSDDNISANTVARAIDDMLLSFAQIIYVDNLQPFAVVNGDNKICDLSLLAKSYNDGNSYVKINYLDHLASDIRPDVIEALNTGNDVALVAKADKFMYYSNILRQNILALNAISDNIDYYKLSLYRFDEIGGGMEVYSSTVSDLEKKSYEYLCSIDDFIVHKYLIALQDLI